MNDQHIPNTISLHKQSKVLDISFDGGIKFELSFEYLRVYSPSADVRGHSPDQAVLQLGKKNVGITNIEPVGNYALKLYFDDGHNTGLYSWDYLYDLATNQKQYWQNYLTAVLDSDGAR